MVSAHHLYVRVVVEVSQDTLPSPLPIGSLSQYYYSCCTDSTLQGNIMALGPYRCCQAEDQALNSGKFRPRFNGTRSALPALLEYRIRL